MNSPIEDRLRAAYAARTDQLTERRLDELAAARQPAGPDELDRGEPTVTLPELGRPDELAGRRSARLRRWAGPGLAAAAVIALAAGVVSLAGSRHGSTPVSEGNHSASQSARPSRSASVSPSASGGSGTETGNNGNSYLAAGQTGSRTDVPWSLVGAGWRLVQPDDPTSQGPGREVYLYDPAGGRYLITDQVDLLTRLAGWSANGGYAAIQRPDNAGVSLLDLRTGTVRPLLDRGTFMTFTRPKGQAILAYDGSVLTRYSLDGTEQLAYSNKMNGIGALGVPPVYLPDGSTFVIEGSAGLALLGNDGAPLRIFPIPADYTSCEPIRLWDETTVLEKCRSAHPRDALFLQDVTSADPPTALIARSDQDFENAWPLSNQDVLVQTDVSCTKNPYLILHPDDTVTALRLPAGVSVPAHIVAMTDDRAVFSTGGTGCGATTDAGALISYDMVTGQTSTLLDGSGFVLDFSY